MKLHLAAGVHPDIDLMTRATAVLANRGAGKTYFASVLAEELLNAGQQVIILDPVGVMWGLKSGYSIPVFGGDNADVPLQPSSGKALAQAVVEHGFSCILDLSEMDTQESLGFAAAFLAELYRRNRQSCYVIIDEADIFAPQSSTKGNGPHALRAMQFLVRRGRARGLGCALVTQRPQAIAKDVLTQCEVLVALRMNHPRDIGALEEWIGTQASAKDSDTVTKSLPSLPTGEAWFWAPVTGLFMRAKVRERRTFDSSATPKPGEARVQPKHLEAVDLAKLGAQIAATVEEQKANDPAALKARIRELERQVHNPEPAAPAEIDDLRRQVVFAKSALLGREGQIRELQTRGQKAWQIIGRLHHAVTVRIAQMLEEAHGTCEGLDAEFQEAIALVDPNAHLQPKTLDAVPQEVTLPPPIAPTASRIASLAIKDVSRNAVVNKPQQKILDAIATFNQANVPARAPAIAGFCGTTKRARGFEENLRQLRAAGLINTSDGVLAMTGNFGHPSTLASGMDAIRTAISGPQFTMLEWIRRHGPVDVETLAGEMQTTVRARGFEENLRRLRADELLVGGKDALRVAEWLR